MGKKRRRGRGEGGVRRRADGLWVASVSYTEGGKRRRPSAYGRTKAEALAALRRLQAAARLGPAADDPTLAAYLAGWLEAARASVAPGTYQAYERHVRLYLVPKLGAARLSKLSPTHVQGLYAALAKGGTSTKMIKKAGTTLTVALNEAVQLRLIAANPASRVRKPKAPRTEMRVLDPGQVGRFLEAARGDRLYALYATMIDSGAGPGELFALTWDDVNLEQRYILIRRSLEEIGGEVRVKEVKARKRNRKIDIAPVTAAALSAHKALMLAEGHGSNVVFCAPRGGYLRNSDVRTGSFKPILVRAGLDSIRLYDLRHTCATLLLLAGENVKVVSERLGHATATLTIDTYSHVLPTMQAGAAAKMQQLLGGGS